MMLWFMWAFLFSRSEASLMSNLKLEVCVDSSLMNFCCVWPADPWTGAGRYLMDGFELCAPI